MNFLAEWRSAAITTGQIVVQGRPTPPHTSWVQTSHLVVTPEGSATPIYDDDITTDENGRFTLSLIPGTYRLWIKGSHTLASASTAALTYGTNEVAFDILREGDANDDNLVNISDFSILASSFATVSGDAFYDSRADFNDDGVVNISDFSLLASNYTLAGAAP
ncbi:MAG: hypothetical protein IPK19_39760 [Chloroflexi bacterium]|nr:hypothetical protein [Chloroflexota bacterium]